MPEAKKFATGSATSSSRLMCVMNRGAFTENRKSSGVPSRHLIQLAGFCSA